MKYIITIIALLTLTACGESAYHSNLTDGETVCDLTYTLDSCAVSVEEPGESFTGQGVVEVDTEAAACPPGTLTERPTSLLIESGGKRVTVSSEHGQIGYADLNGGLAEVSLRSYQPWAGRVVVEGEGDVTVTVIKSVRKSCGGE